MCVCLVLTDYNGLNELSPLFCVMSAMTIAVFLDRDGTLNQERGYLRDIEELVLISGAAKAVRRLNDTGILAILTTNQSGPARGYYDEAHIKALHDRLERLLAEEAGAKLDAIYYSPFLPNGSVPEYTQDSPCRKPGCQARCAPAG